MRASLERESDVFPIATMGKDVSLTGIPQLERERVPMTRWARAGGIDQPAAVGDGGGVATRT